MPSDTEHASASRPRIISSASAEKGSIGPLATSTSSDPDALDTAQVVKYLVALLNTNLLPALPQAETDAAVLQRLALACGGDGLCWGAAAQPTQPLAAALEQTGIAPPGLSALERAAVCAGCVLHSGEALQMASGARQGGRSDLPLARPRSTPPGAPPPRLCWPTASRWLGASSRRRTAWRR